MQCSKLIPRRFSKEPLSVEKHHPTLSMRNMRQNKRIALTNKLVSLQVLNVLKGEEKVKSIPAKENAPSHEQKWQYLTLARIMVRIFKFYTGILFRQKVKFE